MYLVGRENRRKWRGGKREMVVYCPSSKTLNPAGGRQTEQRGGACETVFFFPFRLYFFEFFYKKITIII